MNALGVRPDFHVVRNRCGAGGNQLGSAFDLNKAHAATAFDADVGMVAITRDLDADVVRQLNDRSSFFGLVHLAINRDLRHK